MLFLAGVGTALATGLGAIPVFALGEHATALRPALWGLAGGLMAVASVVGLPCSASDGAANRGARVRPTASGP